MTTTLRYWLDGAKRPEAPLISKCTDVDNLWSLRWLQPCVIIL